MNYRYQISILRHNTAGSQTGVTVNPLVCVISSRAHMFFCRDKKADIPTQTRAAGRNKKVQMKTCSAASDANTVETTKPPSLPDISLILRNCIRYDSFVCKVFRLLCRSLILIVHTDSRTLVLAELLARIQTKGALIDKNKGVSYQANMCLRK